MAPSTTPKLYGQPPKGFYEMSEAEQMDWCRQFARGIKDAREQTGAGRSAKPRPTHRGPRR